MPLEFAKTFVVMDGSTTNRNGNRVMADAFDDDNLKAFRANPVMFYNHHRSFQGFFGGGDTNITPIGEWRDLRRKGQKWLADAYIDNEHELGKEVLRQVKLGTIRGASVGIIIKAISEDKKDMLKGQRSYTIMRAELLEISIVDIPNIPFTLAQNSLKTRIGGLLSQGFTTGEALAQLSTIDKAYISSNNFNENPMDKQVIDSMKLVLSANGVNVADDASQETIKALFNNYANKGTATQEQQPEGGQQEQQPPAGEQQPQTQQNNADVMTRDAVLDIVTQAMNSVRTGMEAVLQQNVQQQQEQQQQQESEAEKKFKQMNDSFMQFKIRATNEEQPNGGNPPANEQQLGADENLNDLEHLRTRGQEIFNVTMEFETATERKIKEGAGIL